MATAESEPERLPVSVKLQRWLSTRRTKAKPKVSRGGEGRAQDAGSDLDPLGVPRSHSFDSASSTLSRPKSRIPSSASSNTIRLQTLAVSPGIKRRSLLSTQGSLRSSDTLQVEGEGRTRSNTFGGGSGSVKKMLGRISPSLRRKRRDKSPLGSPSLGRSMNLSDTISTTSEIWKVGEVRGGVALVSGGEQLKLPDDILTGPLKKEGYLQKHGRRFGGWKRRWFMLETGEVAIFKTETMHGFGGIIAMDQVISVQYPSAVAGFGFTFEIVTSKRTFVLAAETEEEAIHWVHLLRRASHTDKPGASSKAVPEPCAIKPLTVIGDPRTEEELKEGLVRSEGTPEEKIAALRDHLAEIEETKTAESSADKPKTEVGDATREPIDMAAKGLAIDGLRAFLNCN